MAVQEVKLVKSTVSVGKGLSRTYKSIYQVIADYDTAPETIVTDSRIPQYGESYSYFTESDEWAFVSAVDHDYDPTLIKVPGLASGNMFKHVVTVTHSTSSGEEYPDRRESPLDDPPVISGSFAPYRIEKRFDKDNNPLQNTAKTPIIPGVEIDEAHLSLNISYNTPTIDLQFYAQSAGAVNEAAIWGLSARQVKLLGWDWRIERQGELVYVANDWQFLISLEQFPSTNVHSGPSTGVQGWYSAFINEGPKYIDGGVGGGNDPRPFTIDIDGIVYGKLASDGDKLASQESDPGYLIFEVEPEVDFSLFGLPDPLPGPFA